MMRKLMVLGAGAVGYVLGTKAGRERYEQISRQAAKIRNNPTVQQKVDEAKHAAKDAADTASEKVRERSHSTGDTSTTGFSSTTTSGGTGSPGTSGGTGTPGSSGTGTGTGGGFGRGDEGL